jgi:glycosyltransferase involved in cell wall biosynthesis
VGGVGWLAIGERMGVALAPVAVVGQAAAGVELTVVIPCLNEAETLHSCLREAWAAIAAAGVVGEVLVADNGSVDGSPEIAAALGARVLHVAERGYGNALLGGIGAARGQLVLMGDADGSYDFGALPLFLARLREGADLVMGCRMPGGGGTILAGAMPWKHRWIGNPALSALGRLFFEAPVRDFHCGLRAFRRDAILRLGLRCPGMELASEMVVKATLARLRIVEVPVTLRPDGRSRPPHLRSWRDGWRHLRFMLLFTPRWLFLIPGAVLSLASLLLFLRLAAGPLELAGVRFDTNSLLVAGLGLITGVQMLLFGVLAKLFAVNQGLLPPTAFTGWLRRRRLVELGIGSGGVLALLGLGYLAYEVELWRRAGFGDLSYPESLRIVVPAVTALAVGVQLVFAGFMLALIDLSREIRLRNLDPG